MNPIRVVGMGLLVASLALLTPGEITAAPVSPSGSMVLSDDMRHHLETFQRLAATYRLNRHEIWPEYDFDAIPILLMMPDGSGVLWQYQGHPPRGFRPLTGWPGVYMPEDHQLITPYWPGSQAFRKISISGLPMMAIALESVIGGGKSMSAVDSFFLAFHEAFHIFYQLEQGWGGWFDTTRGSGSEPFHSVDDYVMATIEQRVLADALEVEALDLVRDKLRTFAWLRAARVAAQPAATTVLEDKFEIIEGLADYVSGRVLARHPELRTGIARSRQGLLAYLRSPADPRATRGRAYHTGEAMALLLDRLDPRWKAALPDRRSLWRLLAEVCEAVERPDPATMAAIWQTYQGNVLKAELASRFTAAEKEPAARLAHLQRQGVIKVTLAIDPSIVQSVGGQGGGRVSMPDGAVSYDEAATMEVALIGGKSAGVLLGPFFSRPPSAFEFYADDVYGGITVGGRPVTREPCELSGPLAIRMARLTLQAPWSTVVVHGDGSVLIRLSAQDHR